jgi:hypothetical protein
MAVIQICTTCTCKSKPSWVEKSYLCPYVRVNALCSKLEGIFKHIGVTAWTQASGAMAFKFQKNQKWSEIHGTLLDVMAWHQDAVVKKLAYSTKVWTHTPHKPEHLSRRLVVPRGNNACLVTNGHSFLLWPSKNFYS